MNRSRNRTEQGKKATHRFTVHEGLGREVVRCSVEVLRGRAQAGLHAIEGLSVRGLGPGVRRVGGGGGDGV